MYWEWAGYRDEQCQGQIRGEGTAGRKAKRQEIIEQVRFGEQSVTASLAGM